MIGKLSFNKSLVVKLSAVDEGYFRTRIRGTTFLTRESPENPCFDTKKRFSHGKFEEFGTECHFLCTM